MMNEDEGLNRIVIGNQNFGVTGWGCIFAVVTVIVCLIGSSSDRRFGTPQQLDRNKQASTATSNKGGEVSVPVGQFAVAVHPQSKELRYLKSGVYKLPKEFQVQTFRPEERCASVVQVTVVPEFEQRFLQFGTERQRILSLVIEYQLGNSEGAVLQPYRLGKRQTLDDCIKDLTRDWIASEIRSKTTGFRSSLELGLEYYLSNSVYLEKVKIRIPTK